MKILIVGSKGFIGERTARYFKTLPSFEVYECDVMVDYGRENYFVIDSTNADYHQIFHENTFDACINCSGAASVPDSIKNPLRDFTLNTYNVIKILEAIRTSQPACKFINLSSAAVYGNPQELPIHEASPTAPISPYGLHKMQAEQLCSAFHRNYGLHTCSLRVFSAYGSGLKKQLFWDLYQKASVTDRIELFGTGNETRDFIHVDDVVQSIVCCLHNADFNGECINVANGEELAIKDIVHTFLALFDVPKTVTFNGSVKPGDPLYWRADTTSIQKLGYKKTVSLQQGLEDYFLWRSRV